MSTNDDGTTVGLVELDDLKASRLRAVARGAGIDSTDTTKETLVGRLRDHEVRLTGDGWVKEDGEQFEPQERSRNTGPSEEVLLYAFRRSHTSQEVVDALEGLAEDFDAELEERKTDSGKETLRVVRREEPDEGGDDEATWTCAGTTADGGPCTREVEAEGAFCHQHGDD